MAVIDAASPYDQLVHGLAAFDLKPGECRITTGQLDTCYTLTVKMDHDLCRPGKATSVVPHLTIGQGHTLNGVLQPCRLIGAL